ncbi:uncharacterized protein LOC132729684 [Ruditapes philippinarum]|uniref:uncharacterized protein LOC132729684 n=1 Tax=Ruditapes philippinarum TaxID=129788 RepID=UPI00295C1CBD|nr:uncharacterized protein LOC132729684 [Ruditapes philippinarum]
MEYYSRVCLIPFEKVNKVTHVGEGPALEKKASAASAALPTLINFAHGIRREDVHDIVEVLRTSNIRDLRILEGVAIPCMLAKKILSACDLPHDELLDFCGRILNYHTTRGNLPQEVENGNSSSGTALQKVFMMAKDKEVSAHIRITADKLYVRVKEFDQKAGTTLAAVFKNKKIPLYGKSCRFDKQAKKCGLITRDEMTETEWNSLMELRDAMNNQQGISTVEPMPTLPHITPEETPESTPQISPTPTPEEQSPILQPLSTQAEDRPILPTQRAATPPQQMNHCKSPTETTITPITPFIASIELKKTTQRKTKETKKRKIFSISEKSTGAESTEPRTKRKRDVCFLGKEIVHTWNTDEGLKLYKGKGITL